MTTPIELPSDDDGNAPFAALTPDFLLDALESFGLKVDGRLMALNSYENRVYQVGLAEGGFCVVKVYRPQRWSTAAIAEEHAFLAELHEAEIAVVAPEVIGGATLNEHAGFRVAVFPRQGGRPAEFDDLDNLRWMGRLLARLHRVGERRPYQVRATLDAASFGRAPLAALRAGAWVPPEMAAAYFSSAELALDRVDRCFDRAGALRTLRLHGDCHAGNVLWTEGGPCLVDFDDSCMGPAVQDVWMLFSGDVSRQIAQCRAFLEGYRTFREFDRREWFLVEALRTLRLIHHASWIAGRWHDPAFPAAFPWFESPRFWQDRVLELKEQIALMDESPLYLDADS